MHRRSLKLVTLLSLLLPAAALAGPVGIRGLVLRPDGSGLPEARLEVLPLSTNFALQAALLETRQPAARVAATSGLDGRFAIDVPQVGMWQVRLEAPGFVPMRYLILPLANPVELPPVRMLRAAQAPIEVVDAAGHPQAGVAVIAGSSDSAIWRETDKNAWQPAPRLGWTDEHGRLELPRARGERLDLRLWRPGRLETHVEAAARRARITLPPGAASAHTITVREADGRPAAGVVVALAEPGWPLGRTGEGGQLTLGGQLAAPLELLLLAPDSRTRSATLVPGTATTELTLDAAVRLAGRVLDGAGRPVPGALVWPGHDPAACTRSDGAGRYTLLLPAAARARVQAHAPGFLPRARTFSLGAARPTVDLELEHAIALAGRVVDQAGRPLAGVELTATAPDPRRRPPAVRFDPIDSRAVSTSDGRFALARLAPETAYDVTASKAGYGAAERTLEAPPRGAEPRGDLEIVLHRGRLAFGRVIDVAGRPLAGVEVRLLPAEARPAAHSPAGEGDSAVAYSDPEGHFRVRSPAAEKLDIVARGAGLAPWITRGAQVPPGAADVDLGTVILGPGAAIAGRVIDGVGLPVNGAAVVLESLDGHSIAPPAEHADAGGKFRFAAVADGVYRLRAARDGYVAAGGERLLEVAGESVANLELRLQDGAKIAGRILGLDRAGLARVEIHATAEGGLLRRGEVDPEGRYEIADLDPGDWTVRATSPDGRRQGSARVALAAGVATVRRDLEIGGGLTLTGAVLHGGQPLAGTRLTALSEGVLGEDGALRRTVETDPEGRFRIDDLVPGSYRLSFSNHREELIHNQVLKLAEDLDVVVEIATGRLSGTVVEAAGGRPLVEVLVMLRKLLATGDEGSMFTLPSAADGTFSFPRLSAGRYRLRVQHNGYQPLEETLEVPAGGVLEGFTLALGKAAGLELEVGLASGRRPRFITVYGRHSSGRTFAATRQTDRAGTALFSTLPAGSWELVIGATGGAAVEARVAVPGEPLAVVLPDAGRLRVRIPELVETETVATLRIFGRDGRPFRHLKWGGELEEAWPVIAGRALVEGLPAGVWQVRVEGPAGRVRTNTATTTGGPDVEVSLHGCTKHESKRPTSWDWSTKNEFFGLVF